MKERAEKLESWRKKEKRKEEKKAIKKELLRRKSSMWLSEDKIEEQIQTAIMQTTPLWGWFCEVSCTVFPFVVLHIFFSPFLISEQGGHPCLTLFNVFRIGKLYTYNLIEAQNSKSSLRKHMNPLLECRIENRVCLNIWIYTYITSLSHIVWNLFCIQSYRNIIFRKYWNHSGSKSPFSPLMNLQTFSPV